MNDLKSKKYYKLLHRLDGYIVKGNDDHKMLMTTANIYKLTEAEKQSESFEIICKYFHRKRLLGPQKLDILKEIFPLSENAEAYTDIENTEKEILALDPSLHALEEPTTVHIASQSMNQTSELKPGQASATASKCGDNKELKTDQDIVRASKRGDNKGELTADVTATKVTPSVTADHLKKLFLTIVDAYQIGLKNIEDVPREEYFIRRQELNDVHKQSMDMYYAMKKEGIDLFLESNSLHVTFIFERKESLYRLWEWYQSKQLLNILQSGLISTYILRICEVESVKLGIYISTEDYLQAMEEMERTEQHLMELKTLETSTHEQSVLTAKSNVKDEYLTDTEKIKKRSSEISFAKEKAIRRKTPERKISELEEYTAKSRLIFNDALKMGSLIWYGETNKYRSVGPFVDINGELGFITSAHFILEEKQHIYFQQCSDRHLLEIVYLAEPPTGMSVQKNTVCGIVEKFYSNPEASVGIDVALVRITDSALVPSQGQFFINNIEEWKVEGFKEMLEYNSGESVIPEEISPTTEIIMFGSQNIVRGSMLQYGVTLRIQHNKILRNQMVISFNRGIPTAGMSGAGIFLVKEDGSLACIGMAIGHDMVNRVYATPIQPILDALNVTLKKFM